MANNLFASVELATDVQDRLNQFVDQVSIGHRNGPIEWTPPGKWHITLTFLGKDTEAMRTHARNALYAVGDQKHQPFTISLRGMGIFGAPKSPTVLWARVTPSIELERLHTSLQNALAIGASYQTWTPHVTIAKTSFRAGSPQLANIMRVLGAGFYGGESTVTSVKLILTTPSGYQCLERLDIGVRGPNGPVPTAH